MVPHKFIQQYLNRRLDSHVWMKKMSDKQLDYELGSVQPKPDFVTPPRHHQKIAFLLGVAYPNFFFMYDMGLGKTWIILNLLKRVILQTKEIRRALVLTPNDAATFGWEEEIKRHTPTLPYVCLVGSSKEKWEALLTFGDGLIIASYPGLVWLLSEKVAKAGKRKKNKLQPKPELIEQLCRGLGALILDESTKAFSKDKLNYRICNQISRRTKFRYALAGRPFGRDPSVLWAQFHLVDRGETLGDTLGLFRAAFFKEKINYWSGFPEYVFDKKNEQILRKMIEHRSLHYNSEECQDLPPITRIIHPVHFNDELDSYYKRLIQEVIASKGNMRETKNIFLRMRQISSGFLGFLDDETGEKAQVEFSENPKLEGLLDLLETMPEGTKAVIFHEFTYSGKKIEDKLTTLGVPSIRLWSGTPDVKKALDLFKNDEKYRILNANHRMASYALNLQRANFAFVFESPVSVIDRAQMEKRIWREGQSRHVFQYDLVVHGTADENILQYHKDGTDLYKALLMDPGAVARGKQVKGVLG